MFKFIFVIIFLFTTTITYCADLTISVMSRHQKRVWVEIEYIGASSFRKLFTIEDTNISFDYDFQGYTNECIKIKTYSENYNPNALYKSDDYTNMHVFLSVDLNGTPFSVSNGGLSPEIIIQKND